MGLRENSDSHDGQITRGEFLGLAWQALKALAVTNVALVLSGCREKTSPDNPVTPEQTREMKVSASQDIANSTGNIIIEGTIAGTGPETIKEVKVLEAKTASLTGQTSDVQTMPGSDASKVVIPYASIYNAKKIFGKVVVTDSKGRTTGLLNFEIEPKSPLVHIEVEFKPNTTSQPGERIGEIRRDVTKDSQTMKGVPVTVTAVFQNAAGQNIPGPAGVAAQNQNMLNALGIGSFSTATAKGLQVTINGPGLPSTGRIFAASTDIGTTTYRIFAQ